MVRWHPFVCVDELWVTLVRGSCAVRESDMFVSQAPTDMQSGRHTLFEFIERFAAGSLLDDADSPFVCQYCYSKGTTVATTSVRTDNNEVEVPLQLKACSPIGVCCRPRHMTAALRRACVQIFSFDKRSHKSVKLKDLKIILQLEGPLPGFLFGAPPGSSDVICHATGILVHAGPHPRSGHYLHVDLLKRTIQNDDVVRRTSWEEIQSLDPYVVYVKAGPRPDSAVPAPGPEFFVPVAPAAAAVGFSAAAGGGGAAPAAAGGAGGGAGLGGAAGTGGHSPAPLRPPCVAAARVVSEPVLGTAAARPGGGVHLIDDGLNVRRRPGESDADRAARSIRNVHVARQQAALRRAAAQPAATPELPPRRASPPPPPRPSSPDIDMMPATAPVAPKITTKRQRKAEKLKLKKHGRVCVCVCARARAPNALQLFV